MKMRIVLAFCFLLILSSCSEENTPDFETNSPKDGRVACENGLAGEFPCDGYDLMSQLSPASMEAKKASDLWGWTDDTTGKEYALICLDTGLAFVDISDPIEPIYLGTLPSPIGVGVDAPRDVKVHRDHAFIVSDLRGHGMQVFDLTNLRIVDNPPQLFNADTHYTEFRDAHNLAINVEKDIAYAVGSNAPSASGGILGGPNFINIQNPKNPIPVGNYHRDTKHHDAHVVTYNGPDTDYLGKEIYFGYDTSLDNFIILDVTDTFNPVVISRGEYENAAIPHQGWLTQDHRYFLLGDEGDETRLGFNSRTIVFDLFDLDIPKKLYDYLGPTAAIDHNGYVNGNTFYLANYAAGMRAIDITNIATRMQEVGFFDTYPNNDNASFDGAWSTYPFFNSGNIIISDRDGGLFIVKKNSQ